MKREITILKTLLAIIILITNSSFGQQNHINTDNILDELVIDKRTNKTNKTKTIKYRKNNSVLGYKPVEYKHEYDIMFPLNNLPNGYINNITLYFSADAYFKLNNIQKPKNVPFKEQQYQVKLYKLTNNRLHLLSFDNQTTLKFTIKPSKKEVSYTIDLSEYAISYDDDNIWIQLKPINQCKECLVMLPIIKNSRLIKKADTSTIHTNSFMKYDIEMQLQ